MLRPLVPQLPSSQAPSAQGLRLLLGTCFGTALALLAGRVLVHQLTPTPTPDTPLSSLRAWRLLSPDPALRREASLLLASREPIGSARQRQGLWGQGWGRDSLAALALKRAAQAAEAAGQADQAQGLWQSLWQRFPQSPASADALYSLGRQQPRWRQLLLQRVPAHPAALAAALELGPSPASRLQASLHLARWGPRWPGAEALLVQACRGRAGALQPQQRRQLALGLAQLGRGQTALDCLKGLQGDPALELALGQALLKGDASQQGLADRRLLALAQRWPTRAAAREASALLSQREGADTDALLAQLPASLQDSAAVQARLALDYQRPWRGVLQRWPRDPASWELQWQLARQALLQQRWAEAAAILHALPANQLAAPLAARQLFWLGYAQGRLGERAAAQRLWRQVLAIAPGGYYSWRASLHLGEIGTEPGLLRAPGGPAGPLARPPWQPLASGDGGLDRLWRLNQPLEAWESWRFWRGGQPAQATRDLQLEGRLRSAVGDDWIGLGQLEQASLRLPKGSCQQQANLERQLNPLRYGELFRQAAASAGLDPALLQAVARQESRFTAGVESPVGAVGLMQLMPSTASELVGRRLEGASLKDPALNSRLGARYLRQLLEQWQGNPVLAVASYNAGPGAVAHWLKTSLGSDSPKPAGTIKLERDPELWIEAIPYPETRLYTKKVLGNLWSYRRLNQGAASGC
jgi:soluble lytic murein transglycosylase